MAQAVVQTNWNQATAAAAQLIVATQHLAAAVTLIENLHRFSTGADTLKAEEKNADLILEQSEEVMRAMTEIAFRFDRMAWQHEIKLDVTDWRSVNSR